MDKIELLKLMKELLTTERKTDKYADGVMDMYNAVLKMSDKEQYAEVS